MLFPRGECQCGCGQATSLARHSDKTRGWVKGEPLMCVHQHRPLPVVVGDDCWEWVGTKNQYGYGRLQRDGSKRAAHRWLYERLVGPLTPGMQLDHLCRNRACVNPAHLEPVTPALNSQRGNCAKSSPEDVAAWRSAAAVMGGSERSRARRLAARYGVPESRVRNVIAGRTWSFEGVR